MGICRPRNYQVVQPKRCFCKAPSKIFCDIFTIIAGKTIKFSCKTKTASLKNNIRDRCCKNILYSRVRWQRSLFFLLCIMAYHHVRKKSV